MRSPLALPVLVLLLATAAGAQPAAPDVDDLPEPPLMPMAPPGPPAGIKKITDGALTCEQLYAESKSLEQAAARHRAESEAAQKEATVAQDAMMKQAASSTAVPVATSLLGMLPGGSMVGSLAAQAAMSSKMSAMQEGTAKVTASYQRMAQAQEQLAYAQGRNDHLVDLFLKKNCKVPGAS